MWGTAALTAGTVAAVAAMAPPAGAAPGAALTWLLFTGSSVHVAATAWLFTLPGVRAQARRDPVRYLWMPSVLIVVSAATAALVPPAVLGWLLLPYFGWQFLHYQKQNLGMAALAASSWRIAPLRPSERRALLLAGGTGIAGLMAHPGLLGLRVDAGIGLLFPAAGAAFGIAVLAGLVAVARRPAAARPTGFCAVYGTSLMFSLPVFVFASPYAAAGGLTAAHGCQYLMLTGLIAGGGPAGARRPLRLALLLNIALAGGAALGAASHLHHAGQVGRLVFGAYLGAVMAHFVIDAGLWRMRDPLARKFLAVHLPYLMPGGSEPHPAPAESAGRGGLAGVYSDPDRSSADTEWHA